MTALQEKNRKTLIIALGVAAGMVALSFASVPLYRAICQVTGWGGATQKADKNSSVAQARRITVRFNADTSPHLPWNFKPDQLSVEVPIGADAIISYTAENVSDHPVTGTAVYNVTPLSAGKYFNKTQCFCFNEQQLNPRQRVHMPVTFFIDPKIMDDRELRDLETITLSYTFYPSGSADLENATEKLYNGSM